MGPPTASSSSCLLWTTPSTGAPNPQCKPLGGQSIVAALPGVEEFDAVTMLATKIDGTSMFRDRVPAGNAAAANILATLLAARAIGRMDESVKKQLRKGIGVAFFQGEEYGGLGSRAFFNDLNSFECADPVTGPNTYDGSDMCLNPLYPSLSFMNLPPVDSVVAIDQVGVTESPNFYTHKHESGKSAALESLFVGTKSGSFGVVEGGGGGLPPSPVTSFVEAWSGDGEIAGVVLGGYDDAYVGGSYGGMGDVGGDLATICAAATIAARGVIADAVVGGGVSAEQAIGIAEGAVGEIVGGGDEYVEGLYECFFEDGGCEVLREGVEREKTKSEERLGFAPR